MVNCHICGREFNDLKNIIESNNFVVVEKKENNKYLIEFISRCCKCETKSKQMEIVELNRGL